GSLGEYSVAYEDRLARPGFRRRLPRQHVRQQLDCLEVAPEPSHVRLSDDLRSSEPRLAGGKGTHHHEERWRRITRWEVVRPRRRATRNLDVQRRVATGETILGLQPLTDRRE